MVDRNCGRVDKVKSPELVSSAIETSQACSDQLAAYQMALEVNFRSIPQARSFVPSAIAPTLSYRRGKREEAVGKHQIYSRNERWVGWGGVGQLNRRREIKSKVENGDKEMKI